MKIIKFLSYEINDVLLWYKYLIMDIRMVCLVENDDIEMSVFCYVDFSFGTC